MGKQGPCILRFDTSSVASSARKPKSTIDRSRDRSASPGLFGRFGRLTPRSLAAIAIAIAVVLSATPRSFQSTTTDVGVDALAAVAFAFATARDDDVRVRSVPLPLVFQRPTNAHACELAGMWAAAAATTTTELEQDHAGRAAAALSTHRASHDAHASTHSRLDTSPYQLTSSRPHVPANARATRQLACLRATCTRRAFVCTRRVMASRLGAQECMFLNPFRARIRWR